MSSRDRSNPPSGDKPIRPVPEVIDFDLFPVFDRAPDGDRLGEFGDEADEGGCEEFPGRASPMQKAATPAEVDFHGVAGHTTFRSW